MQKTFQSSHLLRSEYDAELQLLDVQFTNGALYRYYDVPQTVADTLHQSAGSGYFNAKIKNNYRFVKMVDGVTKSGNRSRRRFV